MDLKKFQCKLTLKAYIIANIEELDEDPDLFLKKALKKYPNCKSLSHRYLQWYLCRFKKGDLNAKLQYCTSQMVSGVNPVHSQTK